MTDVDHSYDFLDEGGDRNSAPPVSRSSVIRPVDPPLPCDIDAQKSVAVVVLSTPSALGDSLKIAPWNQWFGATWQRIARAITEILHAGQVPDITSVGRWLKAHEKFGDIQAEIRELAQLADFPYVGNAGQHARVIHEHHVRRVRIQVEQRRLAHLREGKRPIDDVDREADEQLAALIGATEDSTDAPKTGPLAGLARLGRAALVGYDALVAATSEPIQWVWDGVCTAAHATEITGPSGEGKTTLGVLLICGLANPTDTPSVLLGRTIQPLTAGRYVLLIEQENGVHSMRRKLEASCSALGLPFRETIDRVIAVVRKNVRSGDETWGEIRKLAQRGVIGATFIDSRARVLRSGESNSEEDQAAIADEITALIEASQGPAFIVSHTKKGADLDGIESISGSAQRGAGTDNAITVKANRDSNGQVTSTTARFVKLRDCEGDEYPEPVTMALLRAEDGSYYVTESGIPDHDERPLETRIETELSTGPKTKGALRATLKRNVADIEGAISNLFAVHRIRTCEVVVRGKAAKAFCLVSEQQAFGGTR